MRQGYTLIELIIVVTVIALITASVVPIYRGAFGSVHTEHAVRDIVALLKYAQERAVTDTTAYRFCIRPETREYWIMRQDTEGKERLFVEIEDKKAERETLPKYLTFDRPDAFEDRSLDAYYIQCEPSGACSAATIELTRDDGTRFRIKTKGKLGHIEVDER